MSVYRVKRGIQLWGLFIAFMVFWTCSSRQAQPPQGLFDYTLDTVLQVDGRQGVASDGKAYFVSGSKALYKYSMSGELLLSNTSPFEGLDGAMNHLGDIDVYQGELYAGAENFVDGRGQNIQIVIYDLETLKVKRSIPWEASSGQVEVCGIAVDTLNQCIWLADWLQGERLYRYDLNTGDYLGYMSLDPVPFQIQGINVAGESLYLTADDGDAELNEPDHVYTIHLGEVDSEGPIPVVLEKTLVEFQRAGEIEGLCILPQAEKMAVLMNRGARIIQGIPQGFYPGYDHEIHEVYIYQLQRRKLIHD